MVYQDMLYGSGVILLCKSGITFDEQTGGYACRQMEAEGVGLEFFPSEDYIKEVDRVWPFDLEQDRGDNVYSKLSSYFTGPKWRGHCYEGIDGETADYIDSVLIECPNTNILRVNQERFKDSHENWIYVVPSSDNAKFLLERFARLPLNEGVLIWGNSD